jgi:alpha-L-fucosidase
VTTQRGDRVYVHILDWPDRSLALPAFPRTVRSARLLAGGAPVGVRQTAEGVTLVLPAAAADPVDLIVVLELGK